MIKVSISGNWKAIFMRKSAFNAVVDRAFMEVGEWWFTDRRKVHFTHEGASQYGYEPRKKGYLWAKMKAVGHTLPLVYSGLSRVLSQEKDIRQRRAGVRIVIHAPTLLYNPRFKKGPNKGQLAKQIPMRDEMTAVSRWEIAKAVRLLSESIQRQIDGDNVKFHEEFGSAPGVAAA